MNWYPSMIAHVKDITRSMSVELLEVELQSGGDLHSAVQAMISSFFIAGSWEDQSVATME